MKKLIFISALLVSCFTYAIDLGTLDTSFSADGWDRAGNNGYDNASFSISIDSQGRALIAGYEFFDNAGQNDVRVFVFRYLADGTVDNSFNSQAISNFLVRPDLFNLGFIKIITDGNDGFFIGYTYENCPGSDCNDAIIYHYSSDAVILGVQNIAFDLGPQGSKNDRFSDMVYIPSENKLAVSLSIDILSNPYFDLDFGVAMLSVAGDGALSMDTGFDTDGKNHCGFNQDPMLSSAVDRTYAIAYHPTRQTVIVAGDAFEGNGANNSGINMAFCEFRVTSANGQNPGTLTEQWSTQPLPDNPFSDDEEKLRDIAVTSEGSIVAAGMLAGANETTDFALVQYSFDGNDWIIDTGFGPNGSGFTTANFLVLDSMSNLVETDDTVYKLMIDNDDGGLIIGGESLWDDPDTFSAGALVRFSSTGIIDTNWGVNHSGKSFVLIDTSNKEDVIYDFDINGATESIFTTGESFNGNDYHRLVAKFHNDMIFGGNFDF